MTPKFLTEIRTFFEAEVAFWQAQANDLSQKSVVQTEALVKETRDRFQTAADSQVALATSYVKHSMDAAERGLKLVTDAFTLPA